MRVLERLQYHARTRPDATALCCVEQVDGRTHALSYRQYHAAVTTTADAIRRATPDDATVIIQLPNGIEYPVAYLAVLAAGRTVFPLHPALTAREVAHAAEQTGARWIISAGEAIQGFTRITPDQIADWITEAGRTASPSMGLSRHAAGAMLLQSSGTTGLPKIVERSAESIDAVAENVAGSVRLSPDDHVIAAIPMCHSYGIENAVVGPLWAGAVVRVCSSFDPDVVARLWSGVEPTVFPAVPVMIDLLASRAGLARPTQLRCVYAAGATMPADVESAFADRFGQRVAQLYGATEIGSVTFGQPHGDALPQGCVGQPMPGVSIRILELDAPSLHPPLGTGLQGQVAVRAPSMLSRYLGDEPMQTIDGHLITGDLGMLDEAGALTITGRVKTLIEVGGMKVNPMEIEAVLAQHPGVHECAVVPTAVSSTLARVTAYFVPANTDAPPSAAELRRYAKDRLAPYKVPRLFKPIAQLPRSSLGKVQRAALAEAGV